MKSPIYITNRKRTASSFRIVGLMLAIAPLWMMLAAANTSAHAQTTSSPADWTQFLRDNMQRWNPYETVLGVNNVGTLGLKWANNALSNSPSSPAVVNGVVYIGSRDDNLYALNASTGVKLWSFTTGGEVIASPAVANGVVYIGSYNQNTNDGTMYALDARTGALLWTFDTGGNLFGVPVVFSPAVVNGVVYIGSTDNDDDVYALNASTGALLWRSAPGVFLESSPAVANGVVYIGSPLPGNVHYPNGTVYALNASTGALLWSFTPVYYYPLQELFYSSPAVANGVVYINSRVSVNGIATGYMYALNASTGAKLWSYTTGVGSTPAVANGVVYVGSADGNVYALSASTGAKLWSYATGSYVESSPAVANGVVYGSSDNGDVYALNASTGAKLWSYPTGCAGDCSGVLSSPTVVDGVLYVGSGVSLYAFGLGVAGTADLYLRAEPSPTPVAQGDLLTYAFPVWNLGPGDAVHEVLTTQVPEGTTFDYIRISGTPGLGTCTTPPYQGTGQIVCHENSSMAPNTTWTVRLTVRVTAPSGTVITESAATMADTPDPNLANNTATANTKVLGVAGTADLSLRVEPSPTPVKQGDLLTYTFPVWNLGPGDAVHEVLTTQVAEGTTFDSIRISGTPGLGPCTTPPYGGTGEIVCHENSAMAPDTTWTVRLVVKVTAPSGTVITESATTTEETPDPNLANNTATVSTTVQ